MPERALVNAVRSQFGRIRRTKRAPEIRFNIDRLSQFMGEAEGAAQAGKVVFEGRKDRGSPVGKLLTGIAPVVVTKPEID